MTLVISEDSDLPNNERIAENAKRGYLLVCELPSGLELYKKKNEAGGWTYLGESCGMFTPIWDDCLTSQEEFEAIARDCYNLNVSKISSPENDG